MRAAVIFDNIGPYHQARLRAAARVSTLTAIQVSALSAEYAWDNAGREDGFSLTTLFTQESSREAPPAQVVRRMRAALGDCDPDVVFIPGWASRAALSALEWCGQYGVPAVLMSESTAWDEKRLEWKERIKREIVSLCSAALVGGKPQAEYVMQLGLSRERVACGYDAVDNDYFSRKAAELRPRDSLMRDRYNLPKQYFLASARFIEKKNFPRLLDAYALYLDSCANKAGGTKDGPAWSLVLLGDGPMRGALVSLITKLGLTRHVLLPGFVQYTELPVYYALASAFIHPSTTEQWGLVVNEAMASGLPVLVSNRCGCAQDLVEEGKNGYTFDPYQANDLAHLMAKISHPAFPLAEFGSASRQIITQWGPGRFADALRETSHLAQRTSPPKPSLSARLLLPLLTRGQMSYDQVSPGWKSWSSSGESPEEKEAVRHFFTEAAIGYSKLFLSEKSGNNFAFRERLKLAAEMTSGLSGRLLDCGCGTGEITEAILKSGRFPSATIVDLSPKMLRMTKERLEIELEGMKLSQLDFIASDVFEFIAKTQAGPFELILCLGLIAHTGRLEELLTKLKSLLSPQGGILLQSSLLDHYGTRVVRVLSQERYFRRHGYRISYFHHQDILRAVQKAGLEAVAMRRSVFGFPFGDRVSGRLNYLLEKRMVGWSGRHGAEALYLLRPRSV